jgi:ABC-type transport system substrate-binding protein
MEEKPVETKPVETKPKNRRMLYAIVAVIVVAIVVVSGVAVYFLTLPHKYSVQLWYNNDGHYGDTEANLATVLKNSIESCGKVTVVLNSDPWAVYGPKRRNGDLSIMLMGWYPDYFDTDDYISPFLVTGNNRWAGSFYGNATVDKWIADEQTTVNSAIRLDRFTKIQDKLAADVPYIPLFTGFSEAAYVNTLKNVSLHPISFKWFIIGKPGSTTLTASTSDHIEKSLDPAQAYDYFAIELVNNIFDTLLVYEPDRAVPMPGLAQQVPTIANGLVSPDGKNYTYNLKSGLVFSDNTALNASVVKRSIDRTIRIDDPDGPAFLLYDTGKLGRSAANGNNTAPGVITVAANNSALTFHLSAPVPFFNDLMAFSVSAPVPWKYKQDGLQPSTPGSVIGSGPYNLTGHTPNQQFILSRNTRYHSPGLYASFGIPTIPVEDTVTINVRSSSTILKNDLTVNPKLADVVYRTLNVDDTKSLQGQTTALGIKVDIAKSPFIRYMVINVGDKPAAITDVRVRQAIAYSVDRQAIARDVFGGNVQPLYSLVPSGFPFSVVYAKPTFQTAYGDNNCAAANALWSKLGYGLGFAEVELIAKDT